MTVFILITLGFILCIIGILGSIIPVLPGLPASWLGLLLLYLIPGVPFDYLFLGITFVITLIMFVLSFTIPAKGAKKYGGSKYGAYGSTIGVVFGIFFSPIGIFIGPFIGAFLGEYIFNGSTTRHSLRAAFGSFLGFLKSTFMNILISLVFFGIFIYKAIVILY